MCWQPSVFKEGDLVVLMDPAHTHYGHQGTVRKALHSAWVEVLFLDGYVTIQPDRCFQVSTPGLLASILPRPLPNRDAWKEQLKQVIEEESWFKPKDVESDLPSD